MAKRQRNTDEGLYSQFEDGAITIRNPSEGTLVFESGGDSQTPFGDGTIRLPQALSGLHSFEYDGGFFLNDLYTINSSNCHVGLLILGTTDDVAAPANSVAAEILFIPITLPVCVLANDTNDECDLEEIQQQVAYAINLFLSSTVIRFWRSGDDIRDPPSGQPALSSIFPPAALGDMDFNPFKCYVDPSGFMRIIVDESVYTVGTRWSLHLQLFPIPPISFNQTENLPFSDKYNGWFGSGAFLNGFGDLIPPSSTYFSSSLLSNLIPDFGNLLQSTILDFPVFPTPVLRTDIDNIIETFNMQKILFASRLALESPYRYMMIGSQLSDEQSHVSITNNTDIPFSEAIGVITPSFERRSVLNDMTGGQQAQDMISNTVHINPLHSNTFFYLSIVDEWGNTITPSDRDTDLNHRIITGTQYPPSVAAIPLNAANWNPDVATNPNHQPLVPIQFSSLSIQLPFFTVLFLTSEFGSTAYCSQSSSFVHLVRLFAY